MEIEIITTKKKITKAIINQFLNYRLSTFENIICLGYLTNISKVSNKYLLLKNTITNEYFKMPFYLYKYQDKKFIGIWKCAYEIKFETFELRDEYFIQYVSFCENANHIIY